MKRCITRISISALFALSFANCDGSGDSPNVAAFALAGFSSGSSWPPSTISCESEIDPSEFPSGNTTYKQVCVPASGTDSVHFRIEGLEALSFNGYLYLLKGHTTAPTSTATPAGSGLLALIHGRNTGDSQSSIGPKFGAYGNWVTGDVSTKITNDYIGNPGPSEICLDIIRRSGTTPKFVLWATGQNGANCKVRSTLSEATALEIVSSWGSETVALASGTSAYFRFSNGSLLKAKKIVVATQTAINATECSTALTAVTTPQTICSPDAGTGKHYRINGIQLSGNHVAFCLTKGWSDPTCQTATAASQFKFSLYSGGPPPNPMSYVDYSSENVGTNSVPSFKITTADICYDITQAGPPRVTIWATGLNGANCGDKSTLSAVTSILNKSDWTDATSPSSTTSYATISNATGTTPGVVTVSSESVLP